jgi:hypothetical protein
MHRILLGTTQSIVSYPRVMRDGLIRPSGVPTSATARRVTPLVPDEATAYVAATIDAVAVTVQGAHLEGAESIALGTAATIVAGQRYLLIDANHGRYVVVEATNSGSTTTMWLAEPLICDIANNSLVRGIAVSVALTAAQTAEPGAGYVLFRATVDGYVTEWDEAFRVVRRITSIALTVTQLTHLYPVARKLSASADTTLEECIGAAWTASIQPWLAATGILDEDILTDDVLVPVHAAAVVLHLARQWPQAQQEYVDRLQANYEQAKETTKARIDLSIRGQEETPSVPVPGAEKRISIRLAR